MSAEELERRYRQAQDPVARSQWQIVWLLARGRPSEQVGETTGYSLTWVYTVARRYNADGAQRLVQLPVQLFERLLQPGNMCRDLGAYRKKRLLDAVLLGGYLVRQNRHVELPPTRYRAADLGLAPVGAWTARSGPWVVLRLY